MGRYTLKINGEPIPNFTKVSLYEIDRFTTNYAQESEIMEALGKKNISISNLKVSYRMNRKEKLLNVALDSKKDLQDIKFNSSGQINYSNKVFIKYASKFCEKIKVDKAFYKFIMDSMLLNLKIKEYIQLYYVNNDIYYENKIKEYLGTYLQFRNVVFLMEQYDWVKLDKRPIQKESTQDDEDDKDYKDYKYYEYNLEDENFTKEEIEKYQEYMDNLPEGEHPHYGRRR